MVSGRILFSPGSLKFYKQLRISLGPLTREFRIPGRGPREQNVKLESGTFPGKWIFVITVPAKSRRDDVFTWGSGCTYHPYFPQIGTPEFSPLLTNSNIYINIITTALVTGTPLSLRDVFSES